MMRSRPRLVRPVSARPGTRRAVSRGPGRPDKTPRRALRMRAGGRAAEVPAQPLWRQLVGSALRRARLRLGWTLRDLAEAARVSLPYLSEIERGRKEASSEILAAICRALGLRLSDLLDEVLQELARVDPGPLPAPKAPRQPIASGAVSI